MTPGNVHDSQEPDTLLLVDEAALSADADYSLEASRNKLAQLGINDQVQVKVIEISRCRAPTKFVIAVTRGGAERPFATYK